jgi:alpha-beta hydrolase superfamily lysophospholipase
VTGERHHDWHVTTRDGFRIRARGMRGRGAARGVVVLVHGIASPLEPTYDLPVATYSVLELLAARGHTAVAFDHRNYGESTRAEGMSRPPRRAPDAGMHTLDDAAVDIDACVAAACERYETDAVFLFGSSRGALRVVNYLCSELPARGRVRLAFLNNPSDLCYLGGSRGARQADLAAEIARANRPYDYEVRTAQDVRDRWNAVFGDRGTGIPDWVQEEYIVSSLASDPGFEVDGVPGFRVPIERIPERTPLFDGSRLPCPLFAIDAEGTPDQVVDELAASCPPGRLQLLRIEESNHFTLRNAKRFELVNILDAAVCASLWGRS